MLRGQERQERTGRHQISWRGRCGGVFGVVMPAAGRAAVEGVK